MRAMKAYHFVKCGLELCAYNVGKEHWDVFCCLLRSDLSVTKLETKQRYSPQSIIVLKVNMSRQIAESWPPFVPLLFFLILIFLQWNVLIKGKLSTQRYSENSPFSYYYIVAITTWCNILIIILCILFGIVVVMTTTGILYQTYLPTFLDVFWLLWMKLDSVFTKKTKRKSG